VNVVVYKQFVGYLMSDVNIITTTTLSTLTTTGC